MKKLLVILVIAGAVSLSGCFGYMEPDCSSWYAAFIYPQCD